LGLRGYWRKLHNIQHVARVLRKNTQRIGVRKPELNAHLLDLGLNGKIKLK